MGEEATYKMAEDIIADMPNHISKPILDTANYWLAKHGHPKDREELDQLAIFVASVSIISAIAAGRIHSR